MNQPSLPLPFAVIVRATDRPVQIKQIRGSNQGALFTIRCGPKTYFCKGMSINRYAPANEWICNRLALALDIPVLAADIISCEGAHFFGAPFIPEDRRHIGRLSIQDARFKQATNAARICYQAVCFDAWVVNPDRHAENIMVYGSDGTQPWTAALHDHDRALLGSNKARNDVQALTSDPINGWELNRTRWIRDDNLNDWYLAITDWDSLHSEVKLIKSLDDDLIKQTVNSAPPQIISNKDKSAIIKMLLARKAKLDEIVDARRGHFPGARR